MTHLVAIDYTSGKALFHADENLSVVVDINKRDIDTSADAMTASSWLKVAPDMEYPTVWRELADAAVTKLEVEKNETPTVERKFRIPHAVKAEVLQGLSWVQGFERGGTPVALSVAKMLSEDTYVPLSRVERIARYFSRRPASIAENSGWSAGSMGFPADERIKFSLWGGEAAREWITKIDKKHPLTAGVGAQPPAPEEVMDNPVIIAEVENAPEVDGDGDVDPDEMHDFAPDPDVPDQCIICGLFSDDDLHGGMSEEPVGDGGESDYFGKGQNPDSTYCTELLKLDESGAWSMYDGTGWVSVGDPDETAVIIMLDPASAQTLAEFIANRDPENQGQGIELSMINPMEAALFSAAEAEIDWEYVQRVFDIYDSQERSINAGKQVRGPGGKFGDEPNSPDAAKETTQETKARLPQPLPLVPDIAARIDQYLADVAKQRGAAPTQPQGETPTGGDAPAEASAEEFNWVEDTGGLPHYIKRIEKHLREKGMTEGHAIATAVNAAQKMCDSGDVNFPGVQQVNAKSRAEACKAIAEWNEKKARAKADNSTLSTEYINALIEKYADTEFGQQELAEGDPGGVTDVRPLYLAIVDTVDTEAVLDVVSLVPPAAGAQGDVTVWKRNAGTWVQAADILADLRGTSPPPVVELSDDAVLGQVLEQVDKATSDNPDDQPKEQQPTSPAPAKPDANPDQHPVPVQAAVEDAVRTLNEMLLSTNDRLRYEAAKAAFALARNGAASDEFGNKSAEKRDKLAKKGYALPDGSYPIESVADLKNAVQAFGRAKNKDLARRHIIKRARALNRLDVLPKEWNKNERENGYSMWGPHGEILSLVAAEGGADKNRGNAEKLRHYWVRGEGAAKIGWNTPGDWSRCVSHLSKYLGTRARGYCTLRHRDATGVWPGQEKV